MHCLHAVFDTAPLYTRTIMHTIMHYNSKGFVLHSHVSILIKRTEGSS